MGDYSDDIRDVNKKATREDREFFSYSERNDKLTKRVNIEQEPDETLKVESVVSVSDLMMIINNSAFLKDEDVDCMRFSRRVEDGVYLFDIL